MNATNTIQTKSKSIIRWEALIPFVVICLITGIYFHFLFDTHLRRTLEWAGYAATGAEVDIASLETHFLDASLKIKNVEVTNAEDPAYDSIVIGEIRFSMLWDALLRAKVVVNEAAIEQISFNTKRSSPGKVKPPEPVSNEPGMVDKLKEAALKEAQEQAGDNLLGDLIAIIGGKDSGAQISQLESSLESKKMLEKFNADIKSKQQAWDQRLKTLPQSQNIQDLGNRLAKIKTKDFKSAQELQNSLQEFLQILKDGDVMFKQVQGASDDFSKDLKGLETQYNDIEKQMKLDAKTLEQHFHIPKVDGKSLSAALFNKYLGPYKAKFNRYKKLADTYLPPHLFKKDKTNEEALIEPHMREHGITYEFGRQNSYPLFWIKKTSVSSKAGTTPESGDVSGEILNISSNQRLTGKPTTLNLTGDFPAQKIQGLSVHLSMDNTHDDSQIDANLKVASYKLEQKDLVATQQVKVAINKADGQINLDSHIVGLKKIELIFKNQFSKIDYAIASENQTADQILKYAFASVPVINLTVASQGELPNPAMEIESNLGPELQKAFEKQLQGKIDEARAKIQALIENEVGKQKKAADDQLNALKGQIGQEVKKKQTVLDDQKKKTEASMGQAQKDAENQGRKQLEKEGQKAIDDLKKKFGL